MIYIFRKEMKKWNNVLWVVVASLGVGAGSAIFIGTRSASSLKIASVNGSPIYYDQFRNSLLGIQQQMESLRPLAKAYGITEEAFLAMFFGGQNPQTMALDTCVKERLIDSIKEDFSLQINDEWFKKELAKQLAQYNLVDQTGRISMTAYQAYLQKLATTPADFEKNKRDELKRNFVLKFIKAIAYTPSFQTKEMAAQESSKKSFSFFEIPKNFFYQKVSKQSFDKKEVENYFFVHKDEFMLPERRSAQFVVIETDKLSAGLDIDPATIKNFYEKNKATLFRVPPKVSVRKIFIKKSSEGAAQQAEKIRQEAAANEKQFAVLAKKYSHDEKTAQQGGLLGLFSKGTHETELEQAAFRLQNTHEVSPVITTKDGYIILQLVERVNAVEKSLDTVKDEIVKILKTKKADIAVKSELETVIRNLKESKNALVDFSKKHGATIATTGLVDGSQVGQADGIVAGVVRQIFAPHKREKSAGYIPYENKFVLYYVDKVEKSHLPHFEDIQEKVVDALHQERANALAKNTITELRAQVLSKKMTFEEAAGKFSATVKVTSDASSATDLAKDSSLDKDLASKLFVLTDQQQLLFSEGQEKYYLARLRSSSRDAGVKEQKLQEKIINQERHRIESQLSSAFIASLHRNAKIEIDSKLLQGKPVDERD